MKGKTQPMIKKSLLLLPLLLVSCTATIKDVSNEQVNSKVYINVEYYFNYDMHKYEVNVDYNENEQKYEHTYYVPPKNYYLVNDSIWVDNVHINNEYFVSTNELFVYQA